MKALTTLKRLFSCLLLGAMVIGITYPSQAVGGDLAQVKKAGVLRHLGIPYANFVTGSGDGLDVEVAKMFARHLGVKYQFVQSAWKDIIGDLSGKRIKPMGSEVKVLGKAPVKGDIIANGLTVLPWRQKVVNYSQATFPTQVWLMARVDSPTKPIKPTGDINKDIQLTLAVLRGVKVFDKPNTCLDASLYDLSKVGAKVVHFSGGLNDMAPAVIKGEADMTLLDVPDALVALEKWPQRLKVIGPLSKQQRMGVAFAKSSPELRKAFNQWFAGIWKDGTYAKLVKKYYPAVFTYYPEFFGQRP